VRKLEELIKKIEELEKRVAALEGQVQAQPLSVNVLLDEKEITQSVKKVTEDIQCRMRLCGRQI
jgi:BMFP domain-containing protein YqiC